MQSDIAAGRRQVRQEQKSIDEQRREIQGKAHTNTRIYRLKNGLREI